VSDLFTIFSFGVGFAALAFYLVACVRSEKRGPNFIGAAAFLSGGVGLPTAIRVWYLAIFVPTEELGPFTDTDRLVIVLGGLALFWMFYAAVRDFLKSLRDDPDES
jgi:hypothetical protein